MSVKVTLHTATVVDNQLETGTTVHTSEADALASLRLNYDPNTDVSDEDLLQHLIDSQQLVIKVDTHEVDVDFVSDALARIESSRPCLDADTTDADLAEWVRNTILPLLDKHDLL